MYKLTVFLLISFFVFIQSCRKVEHPSNNSIVRVKSENELRNNIGKRSLIMVKNNYKEILNHAYPLAFGELTCKDVSLTGIGSHEDGYYTTIRIDYLNMIGKSHFIELQFDHDDKGGYRSWKFINHSDIIAPKELTVSTLLELSF